MRRTLPARPGHSGPTALVYRAIGLGDLLAGVPALRALRRALPGHQIVLAAPGSQAPLIELIDAVDRHLPTEELAPVAWTDAPPDVAIDLHGNGPESRGLLERLDPTRVVGFDKQTWDPDEHERVRWCRLVAEAFSSTPQAPGQLAVEQLADDVLLPRPAVPSVAPGAVVVHPGAASGSRRWPAERFADVAGALAAGGHQVVISGSAGERDLAEDVARRAGLPVDAVLAGATDLGGLAALVAEAALVVCGDTGTAHLASAFATPSVLLFGPTPPSRWGPPPGPHTVLWHGDRVGDPHAADPDPALLRITVAEVLSACIEQLMTGQLSRPARPPSTAPSA
jgi:ADP-heptose:LPS heptosyltransferase